MAVFKKPFKVLLVMLLVVCALFITRQGTSMWYNDKYSNYDDLGVQTFKPRTISKIYKESNLHSSHGRRLHTRTTRYQVKFVSTGGYIYRQDELTMESAQRVKAAGSIERRIIRNPETRGYITFDGSLTKEQFMYQNLLEYIKHLAYWVVVFFLILAGAFKFGLLRFGKASA